VIKPFDAVVIGAGAAGLMCAAIAGQRGKRVALIDHASVLAEKIRISGGGRCNFTNLYTSPQNFLSDNPHFCKSALARYTPQDFLTLIKSYRIAYHEKHKGQLFCDDSAEQIIQMLKTECQKGQVDILMPRKVQQLIKTSDQFHLQTDQEKLSAAHVVIATGGLSIPKIGATDFAYRVAQQFGIPVITPAPALVPLTFNPTSWQAFAPLAGMSLEVEIETGAKKQRGHFRENLLLTHRGLSGPAILQISSYWQEQTEIRINLLPDVNLAEQLIHEKSTSRKNLGNVLAAYLPHRLAEQWLHIGSYRSEQRIADVPDRTLRSLGESINCWKITPHGSEGYKKAEVTRGGISTKALSQQTMMVNTVQNLYFIGEALDVTGWLGGYNFQWAWASGVAAGQAI
jgi:predicted Rossmann fold flavoprotein